MKHLRWIGLLIGVALLAMLVFQIDFHLVWQLVERIGWQGLWLLLYPISWIAFNTMGWRNAFHRTALVPSFLHLTAIRVAGETFNALLPSGYVGGEPIKIQLLSKWMAAREAASSVLIAKSAQSVALIVFVGIGLCIPHVGGSLISNRLLPLSALAVLATGVGIFLALLMNKSFSRAGRWMGRVTKLAWFETQHERLVTLDERLGQFYRDEKKRFVASILWHGAAWIAGSMELFLIFQLIGQPLHWRDAWFMGAMAQLASVIGLIAPAGIGFYEGGHAMAAHLLGLGPEWGVGVSLLRRVREMVWNGVGLVIFWRLAKQSPLTSSTVDQTSSRKSPSRKGSLGKKASRPPKR